MRSWPENAPWTRKLSSAMRMGVPLGARQCSWSAQGRFLIGFAASERQTPWFYGLWQADDIRREPTPSRDWDVGPKSRTFGERVPPSQ